jgi:hypothetical protein
MMHDGPEEAAGAEREEKGKCEKPRITELMRIYDCADETEQERDDCSYSEHK